MSDDMDSVKKALQDLRFGTNQQQNHAEFFIVERYFVKLVDQVRKRVNPKYNSRIDPEDPANRALKSFLMRWKTGTFKAEGRAELENLLVRMTFVKTMECIRYEQAKKRDARKQQTLDVGKDDEPFSAAMLESLEQRSPAPEEALFWVEFLDSLEREHPRYREYLKCLLLEGKEDRDLIDEQRFSARTIKECRNFIVRACQTSSDAMPG